MKREKVDKRYVIRLTESEAEVLEKRFALSGMSSVSAYLRQQVVNGIYLEHDHEELKKIRQAVMSVANNVNQIAHRVNSTSRIYKQELYELQEGVTEIWQQLQSIQSELQKLNPSSMETKRICKEKRSCTGKVQERWKSVKIIVSGRQIPVRNGA